MGALITVIFSSRNGGERLRRTLEAMSRLRTPLGDWRLLAVDNGSTDDTLAIMQSFQAKLPLEVLQEPSPGKNRALNRAIDVALKTSSDLLIFCDDDVLVGENWLEQWRRIADSHPECDFFGGVVAPEWPQEPPDWVLQHPHYVTLYGVHANPKEGECGPSTVYGTNMAVRAQIFRDGARFNPDIGPDGTAGYAMGSETEFTARLARVGRKSWLAAGPAVQHMVRPEQLTRAWVLLRAYRFGRGSGRMGNQHLVRLSAQALALKNMVKAAVFPWLLPLLTPDDAERKRWQWSFDQGYEDGERETRGLKRRWRNE